MSLYLAIIFWTVIVFRFDEKRIDLINAILGLGEIARFRGYPDVQTGSYATALDVASNLPENRVLPKVAVDEDGDILMVWGEPRTSFAMTIQGKTIHMVLNPGSSSTHLDPIIYHDGYILPCVLQHIPLK